MKHPLPDSANGLAVFLSLTFPNSGIPSKMSGQSVHNRLQHIKALMLQETQRGAAGKKIPRAQAHLRLHSMSDLRQHERPPFPDPLAESRFFADQLPEPVGGAAVRLAQVQAAIRRQAGGFH